MTPATDQKITQRYTASSLEKKGMNKVSLQEELGWPAEAKRPVICLPAGMSEKLGGKLLEQVLPGLMSLDVQILVIGKGSAEYGSLFTELSQKHAHRIAILPNDEVSMRKMYAASDAVLFCSDPSDLPELAEALSYGVVPIAPNTKALENYNAIQEAGNAFLYKEETVWDCFGALVRVIETHKFPFDWRTIQKNSMESVKK
jgi:starch synthase